MNANLRAVVVLEVLDVSGHGRPLEFVIDSGYSSELTLPRAVIQSLGLPWIGRDQARLADGSVQFFDLYEAMVSWDGQTRALEILAIDDDVLLGMDALRGHDLRVAVVPGGRVEIEALP